MEIGLGLLSLPPVVFWAMTPRELQAALTGRFGSVGRANRISRGDLDALMRRFPDEKGV
jgi:uncharacterized phage protein (TIGR02216 family)